MKTRLFPLILCTLSLTLSGCAESETKYHGVGFKIVSEYAEEFYFKVWSSAYPESGQPGLKGHFQVYNDSRDHGNTVFYCADGDHNSGAKGNYLDKVFLKVSVYEYRETPTGPEVGPEIDSKRWDGLPCFKPYTAVLGADGELRLYTCGFCLTPEDRGGLEPWTPSQA